MTNRKMKRIAFGTIKFLFSSLILFIMTYPLYWLFTSSFKDGFEISSFPPTFFVHRPTLENFRIISEKWNVLGKMFLNSLILSTIIPIVQTIVCVPAAYSFARLKFKGRNVIFIIFMSSMMIPPQLTMITNYLTITTKLHLMNNLMSLIVLGVFSAFAIFMLRQFFMTIPQDLEDQAKIDGCGPVRSFLHVSLPLAKPMIVINLILCFNAVWSDFFGPMLFLRKTNMMTIAIGINVLNGVYSTQSLGVMVASLAIATLPAVIVYLIFRKQLVAGITASGLKM